MECRCGRKPARYRFGFERAEGQTLGIDLASAHPAMKRVIRQKINQEQPVHRIAQAGFERRPRSKLLIGVHRRPSY